jgi:heme oxygenase
MFVSRSAHLALIKAKDEAIARLEADVAWLRRMVQPERSPQLLIEEADLIIGGHQDQVQEDPRRLEVDSEAARLLSGNY